MSLRLWRRFRIAPGLRVNLSKGGPEPVRWSAGRMVHHGPARAQGHGRKNWGRSAFRKNGRNLNNKISRGGFTAAFLIQCLEAIGVTR
jgi:hypothetical protein